jgi:hypothetical protein
MEKYHYGYNEALAATKLNLPTEDEILIRMEAIANGDRSREGFDPIPTLNDVIKQRQAKRLLNQPVEPFKNLTLQRYEEGSINESQLWDIVEKAAKII